MQPPTPLDLHSYCRLKLAAYKTPALWFYVEQLPMTSSGKIQKFVLRDRIREGAMLPQPFVKPVRSRARG